MTCRSIHVGTLVAGLLVCSSASTRAQNASIVARDMDGNPATFPTQVMRMDGPDASCEYRLEFRPADNVRPIGEVAGNQDSAQRLAFAPCPPGPPSFAETEATNRGRFEEQTVYYWLKRARDFAETRLWVTPPGWTGPAPKLANAKLIPAVLTDGEFNSLACWPRPTGGCMRNWPHEGPKVHFRSGAIDARLVAHEFGHYAAGFVFGHMDYFGGNAFDIARCEHRAYQEAVAETFEELFVHDARNAGGMAPAPSVSGGTAQWRNECAGNDEYLMGAPLRQAFEQAVWGVGIGTPALTVAWPDAATANTVMTSAFAYALATTTGHTIHRVAHAALDHIQANQPADVFQQVRAVFASHGLVPASLGARCVANDECSSESCDHGDGTSKTDRCVPAARTGSLMDLCTHDGQCESGRCAGLRQDAYGNWTAGQCGAQVGLGQSCQGNAHCQSTYCDAGTNTANTYLCMPRGGAGATSDPCTHDAQCASGNCENLWTSGAGQWSPGRCGVSLGLGKGCMQNAACESGYCDRGSNTANTGLCLPRGRAGNIKDPCSHDRQCGSDRCANLRQDPYGRWIAGTCESKLALGDPCLQNSHCASTYCDHGNNTAATDQCMPRGRQGLPGNPCSHPSQCGSNNCAGLARKPDGSWKPGACS